METRQIQKNLPRTKSRQKNTNKPNPKEFNATKPNWNETEMKTWAMNATGKSTISENFSLSCSQSFCLIMLHSFHWAYSEASNICFCAPTWLLDDHLEIKDCGEMIEALHLLTRSSKIKFWLMRIFWVSNNCIFVMNSGVIDINCLGWFGSGTKCHALRAQFSEAVRECIKRVKMDRRYAEATRRETWTSTRFIERKSDAQK